MATFCKASRKNISKLWLTVGHSKLIPVKLIWASVKCHVTRKNVIFKIKKLNALTS